MKRDHHFWRPHSQSKKVIRRGIQKKSENSPCPIMARRFRVQETASDINILGKFWNRELKLEKFFRRPAGWAADLIIPPTRISCSCFFPVVRYHPDRRWDPPGRGTFQGCSGIFRGIFFTGKAEGEMDGCGGTRRRRSGWPNGKY
jgi:hypothetical protein